MSVQENFTDLLIRLIDYKVDFVLVGGLAAAAYGSPQVTQDIDICISLTMDNLLRLKSAVADLKPKHRMHPKKPPFNEEGSQLESFKNIYLSTDLGQLDCLGNIKGIGDYNEVNEASQIIELKGKECRILSLAALIEAKEAMGRPKDREAAVILKTIQEEVE